MDLVYRIFDEIWVFGGSGNLFCSIDGGEIWEKDCEVENVFENFYNIVFMNLEIGFIFG